MASLHPPQLLLGLNLLIFSAFYAWAGIYAARRITTRLYFREMMISMSLWSACYGAEILASRLETKLIWAKIGYIGIVSLPVFWLLFSLTFSGYVERLNPRRQRLLWVLPLLTLGMVFTNEWHHGIWSRYWLDPASPFHLAVYEHGWYFWVHTLYSYGLIFIGTAILGLASFQLAGIYRLQVISVFLGMILALIANAVYLSGLIPIPGLDVTPFSFALTTLSILWAIRRYRLLEVAPLPYGTIMETLQEAILVTDQNNALVYANPMAQVWMGGQPLPHILGKALEEVCVFARKLPLTLPPRAQAQVEIEVEKAGQTHFLEVNVHPIALIGSEKGTLLLVRDVTERHLAQQEQERWRALLQALSTAAVELMRAPRWRDVTPAVLELLGQATDVSRVYLFQKHLSPEDVLLVSQLFEWAAPHARPQIDNPSLQSFPILEQGFQRWVELLASNQVICGAVRSFPETERPLLEAQDIRSILVVPIFVEDEWWGFLGFDECRYERSWKNHEVQTLRLAAGLFGSAIRRESIQLEKEERQQILDVMQEIILLALQSQTLEHMAQTLVDLLGMLTGAEHTFFTLWDEEHRRVLPLAAYGKYRQRYHQMAPRPGQRTLTESALELGQTLIIPDTLDTPYLDPEIAAGFEARSMMVLPLIAEGQKLGALLLGYSHPHHVFTPQEIAIGERTAALVSLVLLKFKAVETARRQAQEAETLRQAAAAVTSSLNVEAVIERILDELQKVIPYDSASIQLLKDGALEIVGGRGWEDPQQVLGFRFPLDGSNPNTVVIQTLEPLLLRDTSFYPAFKNPPHHRIRSWLGVPLLAHGRALGLLAVDSQREDFFTLEHVQLVSAFASQVALALENARRYEETQAQALTDPLTGLYNRRGLMELGKIELARALRQGKPFSAILLDIDHFKRVNDTYGHPIGDQVLQAIAQRCRKGIRELDLPGRYGGEEFLVFLPETDWKTAFAIANRLRLLIAEAAIPTRAGPLRVTISLGVSQHVDADNGLEGVIERADQALYQAKAQGRNRAIAYEEMRQT
jgi:diguanylate cyclase (GGDEF)-like protein/PAS domain S-box-containing protein